LFVTNWRPQALQKAGLDYETLHEKFPRLVYGSFTGYGETGPDKDLPGFDFTAFFARGGFMGSLYQKGTVPMNLVPGIGDHTAGLFLSAGLVTALYKAAKTGKGDKVTVNLLHASIFVQGIMLQAAQYPMGKRYPIDRRDSNNPFNCAFETKDGRFLQLSMPPFDQFYPKFMPLIGREDLVGDERYTMDNMTKHNRNAEFHDILSAAMKQKTAAEWSKIFEENDIPFALAQVWDEVLQDKQAWATNVFYSMHYPNGAVRTLVRQPIILQDQGRPDYKHAPLVGEHCEEILRERGYSAEELKALHEAEVYNTWDDLKGFHNG
jgi:cinnamoyl-CoA:phenyllactate CoA-transferase